MRAAGVRVAGGEAHSLAVEACSGQVTAESARSTAWGLWMALRSFVLHLPKYVLFYGHHSVQQRSDPCRRVRA